MVLNNPFNLSFAFKKSNVLLALSLIALTTVFVGAVHAGSGGMEFEDVWMTLRDWSQGTLGRIIAGSMILVGLVGGIVRQSLLALALGIGGGLGVYNAPDIIESLVSAVVTHTPSISQAVQLSNGLM